ncbi:MAG: hypothetical protein ABI700_25260 [Chloroflexota bacterium]
MQNQRQILSDSDYRDWLQEHFVYSVELFSRSAELYARRKYDPDMVKDIPLHLEYWMIDMSLLQAFLTEFRNLYDFFYLPIPTNPRFFQDARALDFYLQWKSACPIGSKFFTDSYEKVSPRLSHLTYKRKVQTDWKVLSLWNEMYEIVKVFLAYVPSSRKGDVAQRLAWLNGIQQAFLPYM